MGSGYPLGSGADIRSSAKILTDMFGMMLNVLSKQSENDNIKSEVKSNSSRIQELEAKVGGPEQISEKLGLTIRNLNLTMLEKL